MLLRNMSFSALILGLFAVIGTALVGLTYEGTKDRIAANERAALLRSLHAIVQPERHDNDIFTDVIQVTDPELLGSREPASVFRARKQGDPVAAVLSVVAPDGYGGPIKLLVGINYDGTLAGVRVVNHHETPGLGDGIEETRSNWILGFAGKSLGNPPKDKWQVKRDGGVFDQFTGATITPRAVVNAVRKALIYFASHRDALFTQGANPEAVNDEPARSPFQVPTVTQEH